MENFITGFPGYEHEMRVALLEAMGREKYDFFFDKVRAQPAQPPTPQQQTKPNGCLMYYSS